VKLDLEARVEAGRHYRKEQLAAYVIDRLARRVEAAIPALALAERAFPHRFDEGALARWGAKAEARALRPRLGDCDPRSGALCFQGLRRRLGDVPDWAADDAPLLWRFHLHYFDEITAIDDGPRLVRWVEDHNQRCRPGHVGWNPYPVAVRAMNLLRVRAERAARGEADNAALDLHLRRAAGYLTLREERHLLGNHLLKERAAVAALHLAAASPGTERALARFREAVVSQFLPGGGHEERSPRYHVDALRDLADVRAAGCDAPWLEDALARGLDFAAAIEHPDGDVPLFNDGELGHGYLRATLDGLLGRTAAPPSGARIWPDEGFGTLRSAGAFLVLRAGEVAVPHQPAHAHGDQLSFEWSLDGRRVVGNRGTLAYGVGPDRDLSRSTASASTVQLGDDEQIELFSGFRVGWRDRGHFAARTDRPDGGGLLARFRWRSGAVHERTAEMRGRSVQIDDVIRGDHAPATARFYLPDAAPGPVERGDIGTVLDFETGGLRLRAHVEGGDATLTSIDWFPRLGERQGGAVLTVKPRGDRFRVRFEEAG
jgi:hypothetical protein